MSAGLQTINFDEFEHLFTEAELFSMQQTLESGALIKANQVTKNTWNYCLRYGGILTDCEVKYNLKSVKQVHCACGFKGNSKLCKHSQHIIYWHIIKIHQRSNDIMYVSDSKAEINLQNNTQDELAFYLKSLVRNNPKAKKWLEFLLKLGQFKEIEISNIVEESNQFILFLNELSKNAITQEKNILQLSNDLYYASLRYYSLSDVNRACSIMIAAIEILYIQMAKRKTLNVQKFHLAIEKYLDALNQILTAIIAPQSLNTFLRYLMEFTRSKNYYPSKKDLNLFTTIRSRLKHKTIEKELVDTLQSKCLESVNHPFEFYTWDIYYQLDSDGFLRFLKSPAFSKKVTPAGILTYLGTRGKELDSKYYFELFKWIFPKLNNDLQELSITYLLDQDINWQFNSDHELILRLYLSSKNSNLLKVYFNLEIEKNILYQTAMDFFTLNGFILEEHPDIYFDLLLDSQQFKLLANELCRIGTIEQIMHYDPELPIDAKLILLKAYSDYFKNFRKHNIGPKATKRLRLISMHLMKHYSMVMSTIKNPEEFAI
ncbi:MAG: hypothetical protein IPM92_06585 [Saprospiraceae bacterium]|nr:hypothetical protein [Saprospiraceae bacterium]